MGTTGLGERNDRGDRLIEFAQNNALKLAETFFKKREMKRWTWGSPIGGTKNEIDHKLTSDISIIKNINVINRFNFPSDHRMVRGTVVKDRRIRVKNFIKKKSEL